MPIRVVEDAVVELQSSNCCRRIAESPGSLSGLTAWKGKMRTDVARHVWNADLILSWIHVSI